MSHAERERETIRVVNGEEMRLNVLIKVVSKSNLGWIRSREREGICVMMKTLKLVDCYLLLL